MRAPKGEREGKLPAVTQFLVGVVTVATFALLFAMATNLAALNSDRAEIVQLYKQSVHNCLAIDGCVVAPNHLIYSVACHPRYQGQQAYWTVVYRDGTTENVDQACENAPGLEHVTQP